MNGKQIVVETIDLIKRYPMGRQELMALKGVNLKFYRGEFSGVVGPSGSGKTTLLNIIGTLDTPSTGSVRVLNERGESLSPRRAAE
jgi:putative ABC transport system ATP-binding protein